MNRDVRRLYQGTHSRMRLREERYGADAKKSERKADPRIESVNLNAQLVRNSHTEVAGTRVAIVLHDKAQYVPP